MAVGVPDCENGGARCVMVGLQMDAEGKELLDWAISNVAQQGDLVVAVHVCRDSELENTTTTSLIAELYGYLAAYESFCSNQKVALAGRVSRGNSIWEVLVEEAKLCNAVTVVVGVAKNSSLGCSASLAKYSAEKLPATTALVAVQNGMVVFESNAKKSATGKKANGIALHPSFAIDVKRLVNEKNAEQIKKVSDVRSEVETEDDDANLRNSKSKGNGNGSSMISDAILCRKVQEPLTPGKPLLLPQVGKLGTVLHPSMAINATSNNANSKGNGSGCSVISDVKLSRKVQEPSALGWPLLLPQVASKVNKKLSTTLDPSLAIDVTLNNANSKNNENRCSMISDANLCRKVQEPSALGRPLLLPQVGKQVNQKLGTVLHPSLAIDATLNNANSKGNGNGCSVISDVKLSRKVQEPSALGWPLLLPEVAKKVNKKLSTTLHPSLAIDATLSNANSKDNENGCSMISAANLPRKVQEPSSLGWPLLLPQVGKQVNPKFGTALHQSLAIDVERLTKEKNAKQIKDFNVRSEVETEENDAKLRNVNSKGNENGCSMISDSILSRMIQESSARGWPLLRIAGREFPELKKDNDARKMSVNKWVMKLPNRSLPSTKPYLNLVMELNTILRNSTSGCKWFQYDELYCATNYFSSVNLIGKGGSSQVYKGCLPRGQRVAIKLSKLTEEASKNFLVEFDIIIKLEHKGVVPLIGICVEGNTIISVCSYFSNGSLEENIHGNNMIKSPLSWDQRYKVAVGVAEALCYIHNGSSQPVIHRDVKSSNILLSENFEPQLSDFGLAIWAPTTSASLTLDDVVGTFGYLAPEYFMYGKVSDKIDVYAFGVVLLELLTGRKPISDETPKGLESLVLWAKPILERGDFMDALDSNLDSTYNQVQLKRMISAASLCITRTAHLRPQMSKILELLRGGEVLKHG